MLTKPHVTPTVSRRSERLLVANRGEIACRIIRTARRLGITTIAVFSDADRDALHVISADEAYRIGPGEARASYLDQESILDAARLAKADALHPGYGFLSENADFADACLKAGLTFIGPPPAAIRAMGEKSRAKSLMEKTGIPLVPGYHGDDQDTETLTEKALEIGFPILIKASAGGGGKGMKVAECPEVFNSELASAKREALSAFGDDRVLLERYLTKPRHVEVQIFADAHNNCIYLFDRDCSVQRRHQKVIEEAPAPGIPDDVRSRMGEAAVSAAKAIGYVGAGTVEFLFDEEGGDFYFMEMNTRLQVEHPVTEAITGLDLVEWQLAIASGGVLPLRQNDLAMNGHAIEARLYAEDPVQDFLPQSGQLAEVVLPEDIVGVRVDSGVRAGTGVSVHYDPMLAKIIVHDKDRTSALRRLRHAMAHTYIGGLTTNIDFLERIARHNEFCSGAPDTGFIDRNREELVSIPGIPSRNQISMAVAGLIYDRDRRGRERRVSSHEPFSPWLVGKSWRLNGEAREVVHLHDGAGRYDVEVSYRKGAMIFMSSGGRAIKVSGSLEGHDLVAAFDDVVMRARWFCEGRQITVITGEGRCRFELLEEDHGVGEDEDVREGRILSPMPGRVSAICVEVGEHVEANQPLIVVEAMKMEHAIKAPSAGRVAELRCRVGEQVEERFELMVLTAPD